MSISYFITTTIPYVNSKPHIGHAQEFVLADTLARNFRQNYHQVYLQSGTDDNAFKNVVSANAAGVSPLQFVNENSKKFEDLLKQLDIKPDYFVKTSSREHAKSVNYFLSQLKSEDVFTDSYEGLYCTGCEDFYSERDLINGLCPDHQTRPEVITEKTYSFVYQLIKTKF